jgi:hypothetical protein
VTTTGSGTIPDAEPLVAATDLATALRELIELSVVTTVGAGEVRAAADVVRAASERLAVARRPASQLPALDDRAVGRRVFNPSAASSAHSRPRCASAGTATAWPAPRASGA